MLKRNYSLQFIIAVSSILIAVVSMLYVGTNIYGKFSDEIIDNASTFSSQILDQLAINVEEYISEGIKIHEEISEIANEEKEISDSFLTKLNILFSNKINVMSISAFDEKGNLLFVVPKDEIREDYEVSYISKYKELIEDTTFVTISEPRIQGVYKDEYEWVISYGKRLEMSDGKRPMIVNVDMKLEPFTRILSDINLGGSGSIYMVNNRGECIYHPYQAYIASLGEIPSEENAIYMERGISFVDWKVVGVTYMDNLLKGNKDILIDVISSLPLALLIIIIVTWFISWQISKPINTLSKTMDKVSEGDFSVRANMRKGEKEVVALSRTFDDMIETVQELVKQNEIKEKNKRKSELNALQAQINPHFLYNTLDSIMWMAENGSKEEVIDMVGALARLFRISISKGKRIITVEREFEHVRNYLLIQKIRYKNRFDFDLEIESGLEKCCTLKLLIQPIVENALYHGIENLMEKGEILIKAYRDKERLVFEIQDNGIGMTENTLAMLNQGSPELESKSGSGVGVNNVRERIKLAYGENFAVFIDSEEDVGTTVYIYQPMMEESDEK